MQTDATIGCGERNPFFKSVGTRWDRPLWARTRQNAWPRHHRLVSQLLVNTNRSATDGKLPVIHSTKATVGCTGLATHTPAICQGMRGRCTIYRNKMAKKDIPNHLQMEFNDLFPISFYSCLKVNDLTIALGNTSIILSIPDFFNSSVLLSMSSIAFGEAIR